MHTCMAVHIKQQNTTHAYLQMYKGLNPLSLGPWSAMVMVCAPLECITCGPNRGHTATLCWAYNITLGPERLPSQDFHWWSPQAYYSPSSDKWLGQTHHFVSVVVPLDPLQRHPEPDSLWTASSTGIKELFSINMERGFRDANKDAKKACPSITSRG